MKKIKDRITLSILAGGIGTLVMTLIDNLSILIGISQRSYRTTAAGVWVSSRKEAESRQGQLLGFLMSTGLGMVGAFGLVSMLTKYGRDMLWPKGLFFGVSFGAVINAILSGLSNNKVKPKDASSNLSYLVSNAAFGIATAFVTSKMGHDSLFDAVPVNDRVKPTEKTTEELKKSDLTAAE
ncbi:hypothetical protein Desaci_2128 [Desulfosporosinus acidiphilus SJ4]|uniref:Uncharacterized protein n=1 Tax=Desulfosporosinus acidiphilus (strain DSM 22704 / JCM 16185 / SJ4) TaxID=646529 RepID=I4D5M0_DESAJ|nr:hypothetical protein [Desulfosporosinus acidiphilus]AFM41094.1 hypothetical protein Desaci_2128 [Desulfosporosinus acidiphilus SJ4]